MKTNICVLLCFLTGIFLFTESSQSKTLNSIDDYSFDFSPGTIVDRREVTRSDGLNAKKVGDVVHFFNDNRIVRFDMSFGVWLSDVDLNSSSSSAFVPSENHIYVTHNLDLYKYDLLGNQPTLLHRFPHEVEQMVIIGNYLYAFYLYSTRAVVINISTDQVVHDLSYHVALFGATPSPNSMSIFARNGLSPPDIVEMVLNPNGTIVTIKDSPYHADFPGAKQVYIFPDGSKVVDGAGIIYFTSDLTYSGSLAGTVDHADFYLGLPIIMRGSTLHAYTNDFHESGVLELNEVKDVFFINNDVIHLFKYNATDIDHETVNISDFAQRIPGEPVSPVGLAYNPDVIEYDGADNLYILSKSNLTIFDYNLSSQTYQEGFALTDPPLYISFSQIFELIFVAYADGRISTIDPVNGSETPFLTISHEPCGLKSIDDFIFVCKDVTITTTRELHETYDSQAILISQDRGEYSDNYAWGQLNRILYSYRDRRFPSDNDLVMRPIDLNGDLGISDHSPYHSGVGTEYPICVNPNGLDVILGSGQRYDALDLTRFDDDLSNPISACAWSRGEFYTLENSQDTSLQKWSIDLIPSVEGSWTGSPIELFSLSSNALVVIHDEAGVPQFRMHNDAIFSSSYD